MSKNIIVRSLIFLLILVAGFGAGIWASQKYFGFFQHHSEEQSQVLLEKVKKVCKLVTVEGEFSEIYDHTDYWGYDYSPFQKRALMRLKATVAVGFDMEHVKFETNEATKTIYVSNIPDATVLSIDHEVDYYDITEGMFNEFTAKDYTELNKRAKQFIEKKAMDSKLFDKAKLEGNQIFELIEILAEDMEWEVIYGKQPLLN